MRKISLVDTDIIETNEMSRRDILTQLQDAGIRIVARAKVTATKEGELVIIGKKLDNSARQK